MNVVRSLEQLRREKNSVVTVGTFDGVHLAHREIIREVVHRAKMREGRSVVITFDPHPKEVVASARGAVQLLSTLDERIRLFSGLQIDTLLVIPFTYEFSRKSAREFYTEYVERLVGVSEVVVGYDHTFGRDREAGTADLVALGRELDFSVFAVHPLTIDGEPISSTRIRKALSGGEVERAERMLGYPYRLEATVVDGDRRGRTIGFPTANLKPLAARKQIPGNGVYLVSVQVAGTQRYGIMNVGVRPTVSAGVNLVLEVHILDFSTDIYGESVTVTFLRRLRDERKFGSITELIEQIGKDRDRARDLISSLSYSPTQSKE
ncbi:MAG: bifunctional riboflavin kinase/FAD synthetase [Bacteroidetes bacterium]|nr:bifunctional riboflavin kinase/FAD synthetase [Bacteroidota bacterium]